MDFGAVSVKLINILDLVHVSVIYDVLSKRGVVESRGIARQDIWLACLNKTSCSIEEPGRCVSWQINNTIDGNLIERRDCWTLFDYARVECTLKASYIRCSLKTHLFHDSKNHTTEREKRVRAFAYFKYKSQLRIQLQKIYCSYKIGTCKDIAVQQKIYVRTNE